VRLPDVPLDHQVFAIEQFPGFGKGVRSSDLSDVCQVFARTWQLLVNCLGQTVQLSGGPTKTLCKIWQVLTVTIL